MQRIKRSIIWKIPLEELKDVVKNSQTYSDILRYFNLSNKGGNHKTLKSRLDYENIDYNHIKTYDFTERGRVKQQLSLEEVLNKFCLSDKEINRSNLKRYILKFNLLEYKCQECDNVGYHNNKTLSLHLDHINGNPKDNRLENLRFLCPNCHSQTETYCGKAIKLKDLKIKTQKHKIKISKNIKQCNYGNFKNIKASLCKECAGLSKQKIIWPSKEELEKLIWEFPTIQLAKKLGVSDKAIEKRCKKLNISKPPRGYWSK